MFEKMQRAFWKALTPDLIVDNSSGSTRPASGLAQGIVTALGGLENLKSQQLVALTRVRVELRDVQRVDRQGLSAEGVTGLMLLEGGVLHLITPK
ncbi:PTS transporter subunit EIIB [Pseudomonas sp. NPDC086278]|uniref:PTS transporter subunit EIIB n=1 Tax=Pseudomonas sp. NPDC086278 TaxID=3390646 RepID=UPI003CFD9A51